MLLVLLGLLVAAVLPRQTRASMRRIAAHPASSLGWGALTAFVIVPLVTIALVITIVGILLAIPWALIVVPAVFAFGFIAMGTFIGDRLLRAVGYRGESLLLAATVGIVATQLVRLIPYAGAIIVAAIWIIGTGAAIAAFFAWRRSRKQLAAAPSEEAEGERAEAARPPERRAPDSGPGWAASPPARVPLGLSPTTPRRQTGRDRHLARAAGEADLVAVRRVGEAAGGEDGAAADGARGAGRRRRAGSRRR